MNYYYIFNQKEFNRNININDKQFLKIVSQMNIEYLYVLLDKFYRIFINDFEYELYIPFFTSDLLEYKACFLKHSIFILKDKYLKSNKLIYKKSYKFYKQKYKLLKNEIDTNYKKESYFMNYCLNENYKKYVYEYLESEKKIYEKIYDIKSFIEIDINEILEDEVINYIINKKDFNKLVSLVELPENYEVKKSISIDNVRSEKKASKYHALYHVYLYESKFIIINNKGKDLKAIALKLKISELYFQKSFTLYQNEKNRQKECNLKELNELKEVFKNENKEKAFNLVEKDINEIRNIIKKPVPK